VKVFAFCLLLLSFGIANAQQMPDAASSSNNHQTSSMDAPPAAAHSTIGMRTGEQSYSKVADRKFWAVSGLMTASTISASELVGRCEGTSTCSFMGPFNSRKKTYALGMPVNFGMMELTYRLKRSGKHYWFVPAVAGTAFNTFVAIHAADRLR
jgi:hypothetical protein